MICADEEAALPLTWGPAPAAPDSALAVFARVGRSARRWLQRCYPLACPGQIEDAWQAAGLDLVENPDRYHRRLAASGEVGVSGLLHTVAWRALRGAHRRASVRRPHDELEAAMAIPVAAGQAVWVELCADLDGALEDAVGRYAGGRAADLERALIQRLLSGEPDTVVAERHGVRREPLNRARRQVEAAILDGLRAS